MSKSNDTVIIEALHNYVKGEMNKTYKEEENGRNSRYGITSTCNT